MSIVSREVWSDHIQKFDRIIQFDKSYQTLKEMKLKNIEYFFKEKKMKIEKQNELYKKYPDMFREKNLSEKESCMAFGLEIPDEWYDLIDSLCDLIKYHCEFNNLEPIVIKQVKEKFGSLRFYYSGGDDYIRGSVTLAEIISKKIK